MGDEYMNKCNTEKRNLKQFSKMEETPLYKWITRHENNTEEGKLFISSGMRNSIEIYTDKPLNASWNINCIPFIYSDSWKNV